MCDTSCLLQVQGILRSSQNQQGPRLAVGRTVPYSSPVKVNRWTDGLTEAYSDQDIPREAERPSNTEEPRRRFPPVDHRRPSSGRLLIRINQRVFHPLLRKSKECLPARNRVRRSPGHGRRGTPQQLKSSCVRGSSRQATEVNRAFHIQVGPHCEYR